MANVKITDLTAIAAVDLATNDVLPIVDISVDQTKKVEISELRETVAYANDFVTYTQLNANIDAVQSNVQGFSSNTHTLTASANVLPGTNNTFTLGAPDAVFSEVYVGPNSLKLGSLTLSDTDGETLTITGASGSQGNLETAAVSGVANLTSNVVTLESDVDSLQSNTADLAAGIAGISVDTAAGTETRLNANLDITNDNVTSLTTTVDNFGTSSNANATALAAGIASLSSVDTATGTETRLNANLDITNDNVTANFNQLDANISVVQDNVTAVQSRLTTNVTAFTNEDTALQSRLTTNVTAFTNEDTALQARIAANTLVAASNDFVTYTQLNSNINVVQDNVASIIDGTTNFTGEVTMNDDLIVTGNLTINGDQTVINTTNMEVDDTLIMLANGTTGSPANDIGILFNRGNQGNAAFFYDESSVTFKISDTLDPSSNTSLSPVTSANLDVGILTAATVKFDGADLSTAISDNVTTLTNEDTALQSRLTTNVTAFTNEDTALQARITANNTLITELETRRTQNIAGAVSTITTSDLTVSRALVSDGSGKVAVSSITATELGHLDGIDQNINSNLAALAAGISGNAPEGFPTGDYGLLDASNTASDIFGRDIAGLTTFDMSTQPIGSLATEDLGALT